MHVHRMGLEVINKQKTQWEEPEVQTELEYG